MRINRRLKHIAKYVNNDSNVIDVGCDHALLSIYLEKNKKNLSIIASDINEGPLKQAKKNIEKYDSHNIEIKLGSGISTINNNTDTIIISGMGTQTIIDILNSDIDKLKNIKKIILSSNNDFFELRKHVTELGYTLSCEEFIEDRGKYYPIMVFVPGKKNYSEEELSYGINIVINEDYIKYLNYLIKTYDNIIVNMPENIDERIIIENKKKTVKNILYDIESVQDNLVCK